MTLINSKSSFSKKFIYFSEVYLPESVSDSSKFICALKWVGVEKTATVRSSVFLKSHLSHELVISSPNLPFNSNHEIQNPTCFHPTKPATSSCWGDSRHTDESVYLYLQRSFIRRKWMVGNAKEVPIIFCNTRSVQNKSILRKPE